jgi:hypothetical protein
LLWLIYMKGVFCWEYHEVRDKLLIYTDTFKIIYEQEYSIMENDNELY